MRDVLEDLRAEQEELDGVVASLDEARWDVPTPAEPWTVRDQIGHLAFFDEKAALSAEDPEAFLEELNHALTQGVEAYMGQHIERGRLMAPSEVLSWWREARSSLHDAFRDRDPEERLPWFGPPMKARSSAVARLMETWAHGYDVASALGIDRPPTDRLFHVAELGVKTFSFSFSNRGLDVPGVRVRVALEAPSGTTRVWNDESEESVYGPVEEFCLVVAQRLHVDDSRLVVEGPTARRWMEIAQMFAGPPGPGREPATPRA